MLASHQRCSLFVTKTIQDLNEVGGLQLESPPDTTGMAFSAGTYEFGAEDFRFDLGREDVDLFPAPDIYERGTYRARKPLKLPELGHALTAWKGWWAEEFTFRGFGIGFVKPVFRGLLLRPDLGVGVRLPVTLHFRSWESREALPSVALSLFVLWPPAVQVSQAMSYPAELLQELATTAARKIVVPSKEAIQVGGRLACRTRGTGRVCTTIVSCLFHAAALLIAHACRCLAFPCFGNLRRSSHLHSTKTVKP